MHRTEKRSEYYKMADTWEKDFLDKYGEQLGLIPNPSKQEFKHAPDLYMLDDCVSADLKSLQIPFYKSEKIYGIPPQHCWTFNPSDLFEYSVKYSDNFGLYIWKRFEDSEKYGHKVSKEEAVYYTPLFSIKKIVRKANKIHHYIRRMNDTNGNSYGSHGVDLRLLEKLV
jgi:hypothetical protein|tara:strand:+ start:1064 stop:1570 length:507 start_codon:yes stop_codon:yes gene_type:complete